MRVAALEEVSKKNEDIVTWIPGGYSGIIGNELAETLAKKGLERLSDDIEVPSSERKLGSSFIK